MIDRFGTLIIDNKDGTFTREGVTVGAKTQEKALATFNGMAPEGWIAPVEATKEPTDAERIAALEAKIALLTEK